VRLQINTSLGDKSTIVIIVTNVNAKNPDNRNYSDDLTLVTQTIQTIQIISIDTLLVVAYTTFVGSGQTESEIFTRKQHELFTVPWASP